MNTLSLTLEANKLAGNASYIIDTTKHNSYIKNIEYGGMFFDVASSLLSARFAVANYNCAFSNYYYISANKPVSALNLSGRYVNLIFEFNRSNLYTIVPKITYFNINFDYPELIYTHKEIYKTKSDIFGIHYALLKDDLNLDIYNKKLQPGKIIARTIDDKVSYLYDLLPEDYTKYKNYDSLYPNLYNEMLTGIKDFELFYDTIMAVTDNYIVFEKLIFDYNNNKLSTELTNFYIINLSANNYTYSDIWIYEQNKEILLFLIEEQYINSIKVEIPAIYNLNIKDARFTLVDLIDNNNKFNELTGLSIDYIEKPVLTYNDLTKSFNMTYVFYDTLSSFNIASYDMNKIGNKIYFDNINIITPVEYN